MTIATYMRFKDFEDFKSGAEFFPRGRIVPNRIMKVLNPLKYTRSNFVFDSDTWLRRINGNNYLVSCPIHASLGHSIFHLSNPKFGVITQQPYLFLNDSQLTNKKRKSIARYKRNSKKRSFRIEGNPYSIGGGNFMVGWVGGDAINNVNSMAFPVFGEA